MAACYINSEHIFLYKYNVLTITKFNDIGFTSNFKHLLNLFSFLFWVDVKNMSRINKWKIIKLFIVISMFVFYISTEVKQKTNVR